MSTAVAEQFIVELEDGREAVIAETEAAKRLLQTRLSEGDNLRTRIALRGAGDVEGHAASSETIAVILEIEGDTEGHAFSLRFPTPQEARDFERRMLAAGLLAGTIAVGAVGIGLSQSAHSAAAPVARPAPAPIVATAPAAAHDMDKQLAPLAPAAATHDMDKQLAPLAPAAASHDMDKELAPIQTAPAHDMDKDVGSPQRSAPGSTQRMIRE